MKATLSISTTVLKRHQRAGKYTMSILAACGGLKTIRNNLTIRSPKQASMACWNSSANATSSLRQASVHEMLTTGPALTQSNARAALKMGLVHIATCADRVDCAPLAHFDSAALAVLLAWRRAARARHDASPSQCTGSTGESGARIWY